MLCDVFQARWTIEEAVPDSIISVGIGECEIFAATNQLPLVLIAPVPGGWAGLSSAADSRY